MPDEPLQDVPAEAEAILDHTVDAVLADETTVETKCLRASRLCRRSCRTVSKRLYRVERAEGSQGFALQIQTPRCRRSQDAEDWQKNW